MLALVVLMPGLIYGISDVPSAYRAVAKAHDIPPRIFYSIALTESGRRLPKSETARPWPWSANFGGNGRYFHSRMAAWQAIQNSLQRGQRSVDVGVMQINWRYHHAQFHSLWAALDPHVNLVVAANILATCYQRLGDWWESVGCYHAPADETRAAKYRRRVRHHWQKLAQ